MIDTPATVDLMVDLMSDATRRISELRDKLRASEEECEGLRAEIVALKRKRK
jgi:hypothetical protein